MHSDSSDGTSTQTRSRRDKHTICFPFGLHGGDNKLEQEALACASSATVEDIVPFDTVFNYESLFGGQYSG